MSGARTARAVVVVVMIALGLAIAWSTPSPVRAQERDERFAQIAQQMAAAAARLARMPPSARRHVSAGAHQYMHQARSWSRVEATLRAGDVRDSSARRHAPAVLGDDRVSDPLSDAFGNFVGGFTQSETATAWCGNVAMVAFNDSGSLLQAALSGGGLSYNGYSRSADRGATFTDLGFLPVADRNQQLFSDAEAACTDSRTFYYSALLLDFGANTSSASVSKSTDGGVSFGDPVKVVEKDFDTHFIDKEWIAADPTNSRNLYVTYGDFDSSGSICGVYPNGVPVFRVAIELVRSKDGGATWSVPSVIASTCDDGFVAGSQVVVDDRGQVYVAWTHDDFFGGTEIRLRKSTDGGASFLPAVLVSMVVPKGTLGVLQGLIRVAEFASLAVDRSRGPRNGNVYVSWDDGRFASVPDGLAWVYTFSDIVVVRSTDGGATFDASPTRVSRNAGAMPTDHYMPALGVDSQGVVGICYYDRSRDEMNFLIDRRCARSDDGGRHWESRRVSRVASPPTTSQDLYVDATYEGDYDTLTGDFLERSSGLLGAYTDTALGTQDVKANRIAQGDADTIAPDAEESVVPRSPVNQLTDPPATSPEITAKIARYYEHSARLRAVLNDIPETYRDRLSAAAHNLLQRVNGREPGDRGDAPDAVPERDDSDDSGTPRFGPSFALPASRSSSGEVQAAGAVSNPSTDLAFSRLGGFTQNVTSTAWCGDHVVVGFQDSGSEGETLGIPDIGFSFNGVARSTNAGRTFTDLGFLNPGGNVDLELIGSSVVACTNDETFYYAALALDFGPFTSGASVSTSLDGGLTFGDPVNVVAKSLGSHFIDREWLAVDPKNRNNLYVTYTDVDLSGSICGFDSHGPISRSGIELAKSADGGRTWTPPIAISSSVESCAPTGIAAGSQIVVDGQGRVYVAWHEDRLTTNSEMRIARSIDGGVSFAPSVKAADVHPTGERSQLTGGIAISEFPTLTVDRSNGPWNGTLHVAWNDGTLQFLHPGFSSSHYYGFADIVTIRSADGGATWTAPVRVNDNTEPLTTPSQLAGHGTDQFMPAVAVDRDGVVGICFYDRRGDPLDFLIERRCARSLDGGRRWQNSTPFSDRPFTSLAGQDLLVDSTYVGDYDTLASDFVRKYRGFVGAYGDNGTGNPNARVNKF